MGTGIHFIAVLIIGGIWTNTIFAAPDSLYIRCLNALRIVWEDSPVKGKLFHPVPISETIPNILVRDTDGKMMAMPSFNKVNELTLPLLFSHQYEANRPNQYGAKGLVYKALNGEWKVLMWSTGQGIQGNNLHHRDALASVLEYESGLIELVAMEKESTNLLKLSMDLKGRADIIRNVRRQENIADELLTRFHGFEMRALKNPTTGTLFLDTIDMESSLASTLSSREIQIDGLELQAAMNAIQASIIPELYPRAYKISRGAKIKFKNRNKLFAPAGTYSFIVPLETK